MTIFLIFVSIMSVIQFSPNNSAQNSNILKNDEDKFTPSVSQLNLLYYVNYTIAVINPMDSALYK